MRVMLKAVAVPHKTAGNSNSPLDHVTACVTVAALVACVPWNVRAHVRQSQHDEPPDHMRSSQRCRPRRFSISTPLVLSWPTSKSPGRCANLAGLSSRQQVSSYAHHAIAPRTPSRFQWETSFRLDLTLVNSACRSRFWRVLDYVPPSRNGTPFIVCLNRTMLLNRMISFRSDLSGSSFTKSEPLQVVAFCKNHEIVSVTKQRDVSLSLCVCQTTNWTFSISNLKFCSVFITIVIKFVAVSLVSFMLFNKNPHMSGFSH